MQEGAKSDKAKSGPGRNIAADHALQMDMPPEHLVRGRMGKAPYRRRGNAHTDQSKDDGWNPQVLHQLRPDRSQDHKGSTRAEA